ncbi:MAG TPA: acireductone synthase [Gammaproteobacteria bacterium]
MIKAIVCDIEGTTTSLSFVKDTLFPYARRRMADFVKQNQRDPEITAILGGVKREMQRPDATLEDVIAQLVTWIDADKKITPLKAIQGHIWRSGYQNGDYHGHVYPDAYEKLKDWHESGIALYLFSSGSVYAQKLLFAHTEYGDLTPLFRGYFDTTVGAKIHPASYAAIVGQIGFPAPEIAFLSDIEKELDAAKSAGLSTVWLVREGNLTPGSQHPQVTNFYDIAI